MFAGDGEEPDGESYTGAAAVTARIRATSQRKGAIMTDIDLESQLASALRQRYPKPPDVDLLARFSQPVSRMPRMRVALAAAVCAAFVAALCVVLTITAGRSSDESASAASLVNVNWQGAEPTLTVSFTDHSVRIFDGCRAELRRASIGNGVLDIGAVIAPGGLCLGPPAGPQSPIAKFDAVMSNTHLAWHRQGNELTLATRSGQSIRLRAAGSPPAVQGRKWILDRYTDSRGRTRLGGHNVAKLLVSGHVVRASDTCRDLIGKAVVTDTTIEFSGMRSTHARCAGHGGINAVVDQALSGTDTYTIRGALLIINGTGHSQLVYTLGLKPGTSGG